MYKESDAEKFFDKSHLTLDMVGLTDEQKKQGSIFLGGSAAEFVNLDDKFSYEQVHTVVFKWGDKQIEPIFAHMIEHNVSPHYSILPFALETVIGEYLWNISLQSADFDPKQAYISPDMFTIVPYDENLASLDIQEVLQSTSSHPQILGQVANRYVFFEMGLKLNENN